MNRMPEFPSFPQRQDRFGQQQDNQRQAPFGQQQGDQGQFF